MALPSGASAIGLGFILSFKSFGLANIDKASRKVKGLGNAGEDAAKKLAGIKKLAGVGAALTTIGAGAVAGFGMASNKAVEFQYAMTEVKTIMSAEMLPEFERMSAEVQNLAMEAGEEPALLSKALYQTVSAGIYDADEAMIALEASMKAGIAGMSDTFTAVDALTSIMNAYGLDLTKNVNEQQNETASGLERMKEGAQAAVGEVNTATDVFDTMFIAVREGKTRFEELNAGLGKVAKVAQSAGLSYRELIGSTSTLTKFGLRTSEAYTGMRSALIGVTKQVEHTKFWAKILGAEFDVNAIKTKGWTKFLGDLGGKVSDFSAKEGPEYEATLKRLGHIMQTGVVDGVKLTKAEMGDLSEVFEKVKNKTFDSSEAFIGLLGRVEGANAVMALTSNSAALLKDMMAKMADSVGANERAFQMVGATIQRTKMRIHAIASVMMIKLGDAVNKVVGPALLGLEKILKGLVTWMTDNPAFSEAIIQFTAFGAVITLLTGIVLLFAAGWQVAALAIGTTGIALWATLWPILLVVVAIGAAFALVKVGFESWNSAMGKLKAQAAGVGPPLTLFERVIVSIGTFLRGIGNVLGPMITSVWERFGDALKELGVAFAPIMKGMREFLGNIMPVGESAEGAGNSFGKWAGMILLFPFEFLITSLKALTWVINWVTEKVDEYLGGWGNVFSETFGFIGSYLNFGLNLFKVFVNQFMIIWDAIKPFFAGMWDVVVGIFTGNFGLIKQGFSDLWEWLQGLFGVGDRDSVLVGTFLKLVDNAVDLLRSFEIDLPGFDPVYPFSKIPSVAEMAGYAEGGIVTKPTMAMIGEAGPEIIIPLRKLELEGNSDDRGTRFNGMNKVGTVRNSSNESTTNNYGQGELKINVSEIINAMDRRNVLTVMGAGLGVNYSLHGVG